MVQRIISLPRPRQAEGTRLWPVVGRGSPNRSFPMIVRCALCLAVLITVTFLLPSGLRVRADDSDMHIDQVKGEYTDQIEALYGSESRLYIAILSRAHVRIHQWQTGSIDNAIRMDQFESIGSITALHGGAGQLWIGSGTGEIYQWQIGEPFDAATARRTKVEGRVEALYWDGSVLWIGATNRLLQFRGNQTEPFAVCDAGKIRSIFGDDSQLWIGTGQGLFTCEKVGVPALRRFAVGEKLDGETINAVRVIDGKVWLGADSGLYRWQEGSLKEIALTAKSNKVRYIKSLFGDSSRLWIGTEKGLFRIEGTNSKWEAGIEITGRLPSSIGTDDPIAVTWEVHNYAGRTSPQLVDQKVVVYGGDEPQETAVARGSFQAVIRAPGRPGNYRFEIQAMDLNGEVDRKVLQFAVASSHVGWDWVYYAGKVWLVHGLFWVLLLFAYPKYPQVQAMFFWNPWVRRIFGLGYVGILITFIPFLQRKLLAPFRESLAALALIDTFKPVAYFDKSEVVDPGTGHTQLLKDAIPDISGQVVLEGESGLGKSVFLRRLVTNSKRIVVYLPAQECAGGVIQAIQNRLHGPAKDTPFLQNLVFTGALDICIDGLNEVAAETRATISAFANSYLRANIIMATQPIEWKAPIASRKLIIQPLTREQVEEFLLLLGTNLAAEPRGGGPAYEQSCRNYLSQVFEADESIEDEGAASVRRILSNPMDLSVVAEILSRGERPDLLRLLEQQYKIMAADYSWLNHQREFPLAEFSERVYMMKLEGRSSIPWDVGELECMKQHKMVVLVLKSSIPDTGTACEWRFRHDKIMDFFVMHTFLGANNDRPTTYLSDPRFRGVYFLLAMLMPLQDAETLREQLIQYAADTSDHTISDRFVRLLRSRKKVGPEGTRGMEGSGVLA
jgi:hypothetical protein